MILRVIAYGDPSLRRESVDIDENYPNLPKLLEDMYETMYESNGVGLAAPQIGLSINLFVIDTTKFEKYDKGVKKAFINPIIVEKKGKKWTYEEGCLSLPKIREDVDREEKVLINYLDEDFTEHEEWFDRINARVILHENDHLHGILFIDHLSSLKRRVIKNKLDEILHGTVKVDYPMKFYRKTAKSF